MKENNDENATSRDKTAYNFFCCNLFFPVRSLKYDFELSFYSYLSQIAFNHKQPKYSCQLGPIIYQPD